MTRAPARHHDAGIVTTDAQGRHRYHRLASPDIAGALEAMLAASADVPLLAPAPLPRIDAKLRSCRSCYDHLAGGLGVGLRDALVDRGWIVDDALTVEGRAGLADVGIDLAGSHRRALVRSCLDWSERRPHLAGVVAAAILDHALENRWLRRDRTRPRVLIVSDEGRRGFVDAFGLACDTETTETRR